MTDIIRYYLYHIFPGLSYVIHMLFHSSSIFCDCFAPNPKPSSGEEPSHLFRHHSSPVPQRCPKCCVQKWCRCGDFTMKQWRFHQISRKSMLVSRIGSDPKMVIYRWWICSILIMVYWLVVSNMWNIFHFINKGCHPSHWRTPSFFKMVIAPPTRTGFGGRNPTIDGHCWRCSNHTNWDLTHHKKNMDFLLEIHDWNS